MGLTLEEQNRGMVREPVQPGSGRGGLPEDLRPASKAT